MGNRGTTATRSARRHRLPDRFPSSTQRIVSSQSGVEVQARGKIAGLCQRACDMAPTKNAQPDNAALPEFQKTVDEILALRENEDAYSVKGEFGPRTSWFYSLLKKRLRIDLESGRIKQVKLRCSKGFFELRYKPKFQYDIDEDAGACWLELIGKKNSTLTLTQR